MMLFTNFILMCGAPYMGVNPSGEYLIGQMPLPKEYGNIVVRRRQPLQPKISGLHKIEIGMIALMTSMTSMLSQRSKLLYSSYYIQS